MSEYHKIPTVFQRDPAVNYKGLLIGTYATPELEYLASNRWAFTEKVDGTNIRVIVAPTGAVAFGGRTDTAQISATLVKRLQERFLGREAKLAEAFPGGAVLYGEGYGARIQKGGGNYRPDQDFVLFDVNIGGWWLLRDSVEAIARNLGLDVVPEIGNGSLLDAVAMAEAGFGSSWGAFEAEGIVARPLVELRDRRGHRLIAKIKCRDFRHD